MARKVLPKIYFDYAATTPVDKQVVLAMSRFWSVDFGNPSSLHSFGEKAALALRESRNRIASLIGAKANEIIFTSGGTESCNLAILGTAANFVPSKKFQPHIISTEIEHEAVLEPLRALTQKGFKVSLLKVNRLGHIDINDLEKTITPQTILISIMLANNEIGSVQPILEVVKLLNKINIERRRKNQPEILLHTDACQGFGSLEVNVQKLPVDLLTLNGGKIYGPKQSGILYVRSGVKLSPIIFGGGQEQGIRNGTENVAFAAGLALAIELSVKNREAENKRLGKLQNYLVKGLEKKSNIKLNGPEQGSGRLLNNINFSVLGVEGEALMFYLNALGVCVATGSACGTAELDKPSHVLKALGLTDKEAKSAIRVTLGKYSTMSDVKYFLKVLPKAIELVKGVSTFN